MFKDMQYYRGLNLTQCAQTWRASKEQRNSEAFRDVLSAIVILRNEKEYTSETLLVLLGEPDQKDSLQGGEEVWEYFWEGTHGMNTYTSSTPFIIKDGIVIGVRRDLTR